MKNYIRKKTRSTSPLSAARSQQQLQKLSQPTAAHINRQSTEYRYMHHVCAMPRQLHTRDILTFSEYAITPQGTLAHTIIDGSTNAREYVTFSVCSIRRRSVRPRWRTRSSATAIYSQEADVRHQSIIFI